MKKNRYMALAVLSVMLFAAASCTDFDDYNKVASDNAVSGSNQTLWENIQQNPQLSDFAALVQKAGFDKELSAAQYYTVWAPLNGMFNPDLYQGMANDALLKEFVKNHIASYGHNATGKLDKRIFMLNDKSYDFVGDAGSYTFDGIQVETSNIAGSNGVMHTLKGVASFYPNIYEYVMDADKMASKSLDSLYKYFLRHEEITLDKDRSVLGPIVNGMQTYVDSVMDIKNELWNTLNAKINVEDSSYTFLMPTNKAWVNAYNKIKSNFNYMSVTNAQAFDNGVAKAEPNSVTIDATYWQDSIVNNYLTRYLAYSNTNGYNKWLVGDATYLGTDTLYTTTRAKLSNPQEILNNTEIVDMSNGVGRIIDNLAIRSWETFSPERYVSATNTSNIARYYDGSRAQQNYTIVDVSNVDATKLDLSQETSSIYRYLLLEPSNNFATPELILYLPNVQSTTYDIYCIFVPQNVDLNKSDAITLPNRVNFTLNYCDADGTLKEHLFLDENEEHINSFMEKFPTTTNENIIKAFSNDTSKVDTLYLGEFTFPICYTGLASGLCPNLKIKSPLTFLSGAVFNAYAQAIRIAGIILRPKELVEFEESNKK